MNSEASCESIFHKVESLHPDLVPYCFVDRGMKVLKHPLVFSVPHFDEFNAWVNRSYEHKRDAVQCAIDDGKWHSVIMLHERPFRFEVLSRHWRSMSDRQFWEVFGGCWTDSENIWQNKTIVQTMLRSGRPGKHHMMDDAEREILASLPDEITVHRGHQKQNRSGLSWTLNRETAKWFATRFRGNGLVTTGTVRRSNVIAYFDGRNEAEIVCFPRFVRCKQTEMV